ncbi:Zinc finger C2HC domain-containing protein 1C [Armadillidium vulgare]|nr:Zinc finger C2HC domain-containing protein 1C [Armadillidium vulgare]
MKLNCVEYFMKYLTQILRNNLSTAASNRSGVATPRRAPNTPVPSHLRRCKICERNFAPDRIQKHEEICKKNKIKAKKRKIFDPVKMRTVGTEAEKFVARGDHLKETKKPKKKDWRKEHENFIQTVRAAKGVKGYVAPPIDTSDYIECPHCGRKFNVKAADRHIPKCADITSNKNYRKAEQQKAPVAPSRRRR